MAIRLRSGHRLRGGERTSATNETVSESAQLFELVRDFGLSPSDFFRIFPRIEAAAQRVDDRTVKILRADGRTLEIKLSDERTRRLATLRIPYVDITFRFSGWSEAQRAEFFKNFDRSFQKGGG
jgi:hypothetical protein